MAEELASGVEEGTILVLTWGRGVNGELGRGDFAGSDAAGEVAPVPDLIGQQVVHISSGLYHSTAVTSEGALYAWGAGTGGQLGTGDGATTPSPALLRSLRTHRRRATSAACGRSHTLVLTAGGQVLAAGRAARGQLGVASGPGSFTDALEPRLVRFGPGGPGAGAGGAGGRGEAQGSGRVRALAAGEAHSLALTEGGLLFAWGSGAHGRLGLGAAAGPHHGHPALGGGAGVGGLAGVGAAAAPPAEWAPVRVRLPEAAAPDFGDAAGAGWRLGAGADSGGGARAPLMSGGVISRAVRISLIAAGWRHSLAVSSAGRLFAWGSNAHGQLGLGSAGGGARRGGRTAARLCCRGVPTAVDALSRETVVAIAAGGAHSLACSLDGGLFAWGANAQGQLGLGAFFESADAPTLVDGPPLGGAAAGAAEAGAEAEAEADGAPESGLAAAAGGARPRRLPPRPAASLSAGAEHSAVATADGEVWLSGSDVYGQLGGAIRPFGPAGLGAPPYAARPCRSAVFCRTPLERALPGPNPSPDSGPSHAAVVGADATGRESPGERGSAPAAAALDESAAAGASTTTGGGRPLHVRALQVACGAWHTVALVSVGR